MRDQGDTSPLPETMQLNSHSSSDHFGKYLAILFELALILGVVYLLDLERHRHFFPLMCVIVGGFSIHAWLPMKYRLRFFATLSMACVLFVLGVVNGLWVLGLGGALIGICYLPIGFGWRFCVIVAAGAALAYARTKISLPFWPVLGSMFMFRLIIYLQYCNRSGNQEPVATTMAYFFMLPNVCFPLFPVVDYRTFRDSWYQVHEWETYQRGVTWIVRGMMHLLFYRFVKLNLLPEPYELYDVQRIAVFMAANYALYLQVSGQFHLITGVLHLFGFRLPPTHHLFFLASSFSDIWRRINIYWKDFMAKLIFFPMFFALRGRGASLATATVSGVFGVFLCTWLLHSWQTFWLLGRFPLTANDAWLWFGAGTCVAVHALLDSRRSTKPSPKVWTAALVISLKTVAMFSLVSLFWACWTNPGFLSVIESALGRPGAGRGLLVVLAWLFSIVAVGVVLYYVRSRERLPFKEIPALDFQTSAKLYSAGLGVLLVIALPSSSSWFTVGFKEAISGLRTDPVLAEQVKNRLAGYYEDLNMVSVQAGPLVSAISPVNDPRAEQAQGFYKVSRLADAYQEVELIPNIETELEGCSFSVNKFGMRDRMTLTLDKPRGTIRIALVGSSIVMGYGVSNDEVFSQVFERRLNLEHSNPGKRFEVLNFGVGKQWAPQRLIKIQRTVIGFEPDAIFYFAHQDEMQGLASYFAHLIDRGLELPSRHLKEIVGSSGIAPGMAPGAIQARLQRHEPDLLGAVYKTIVDECGNRNISAVWIYLPVPGEEEPVKAAQSAASTGAKLIPIAASAGFKVCDLSDWATTREDLFPTAEHHPNARGHQLIADALMRLMQSTPAVLPESRTGKRSP